MGNHSKYRAQITKKSSLVYTFDKRCVGERDNNRIQNACVNWPFTIFQGEITC